MRCTICRGAGFTMHYDIPWGMMDFPDPPERDDCEDCGGSGYEPHDEPIDGYDEWFHSLKYMRWLARREKAVRLWGEMSLNEYETNLYDQTGYRYDDEFGTTAGGDLMDRYGVVE